MRHELKKARTALGLTQKEAADKINIGLRFYQHIEGGTRKGDIDLWDSLEDLFGIPQRKLRENQDK